MELFIPIFNQMIFLFSLIVIGFLLLKWKLIPDNSTVMISKLENILFVPALVMYTFMNNCTLDALVSVWKLLILAILMLLLMMVISVFVAKLCFKEQFLQKIATYGLVFSNFGFMGNAIMNAIFPEIFFEYTIFTLPFWCMIYLWAVPMLLIPIEGMEGKMKFKDRLKSFCNPMLIAMLIGAILGLSGVGAKLPTGIRLVIKVSGDCMSPLAMLLTGMAIAQADIMVLLKKWRIYFTSFIKLVIYPLLVLFILALLPQNSFFTATFFKCAVCMAAMPMGLNAIVIPAAYGKDTSDAAGLAMISHLFSVGTIPLMFMLLRIFVL